MEINDPDLKLKAATGNEEIQISSKAAKRSVLLKGIIEDYRNNDNYDQPINFPYEENILKKAVEYLKYYEDKNPSEVKLLKNKDFKECVSEWDYNYLDIDYKILIPLFSIANYMDVQSLLSIISAKIAYEIKRNYNQSFIKEFEDIIIDIEKKKEEASKDKAINEQKQKEIDVKKQEEKKTLERKQKEIKDFVEFLGSEFLEEKEKKLKKLKEKMEKKEKEEKK